MSTEPKKLYSIGEQIVTPVGLRELLDITEIRAIDDSVADYLYHFGDDYEEKFTGKEMQKHEVHSVNK